MQSGFHLRIPSRVVLGAWCALMPAAALAVTVASSPRTRATRIKPRVERSAESRFAGEGAERNPGYGSFINRTRGAGDRSHGDPRAETGCRRDGFERPLRGLNGLSWWCSQGSASRTAGALHPGLYSGRPRCGLDVFPAWAGRHDSMCFRLEVPAGFYASFSDGVLHPLTSGMTADVLGPLKLGFTLSQKLSDTFLEVLQFETQKDPMGASGHARHPQTTLVVPISRERYV